MSSNFVKRSYPVPVNIYKKTNTPFGKLPYKIPSPQEIVHPFYKPDAVASLGLCMKEAKPTLLDGQFIVPSVIKHPKKHKYMLVDGALKFSTVQGVNMWLKSYMDFINQKFSVPELVTVNERYKSEPFRRLSADTQKTILHELKSFTENRSALDSATMTKVIDRLTANLELGLFAEDILIFSMSHIAKSPRDIGVIITVAADLLHSRIDQMKSVGNILFACLTALEKMDTTETACLCPLVDDFLSKIGDKFHISNVYSRLNPTINEKLFHFFIRHENLEEATFAINALINRNVKPEGRGIVQYLNLLEKKFPATSSENYKHKFAYTSSFSPILNYTKEPAVFGFLIRLCRHNEELKNVFELIDKSHSASEILTTINSDITNKIRQLSRNYLDHSCNLSAYLALLKRHFPGELPKEMSWTIFCAFFKEGNFIMASRIFDEQNLALTPVVIDGLVSQNKKLRQLSMKRNYIGFTYNSLTEFIKKYFSPHAKDLSEENRAWINKF
ncbi:hypothetical protein RNJ44_04682 [Nakaseomyces bracarensis]|uniref:ATPase expression protein 1 n=1 Tax=Nakaseomyces bracarensis TaxID=273131 RepID=A0ABR4NVK0_9SACH